jgi:hypothetical protein
MTAVLRKLDHTRWVFFGEKHLVNKDTLLGKVRANPLTGQIDAIGVSGDFREAYNLIAAISCNLYKPRPMVYSMGKDNGNVTSFMLSVCHLIADHWLCRGDIICANNARIHTGGKAIALQYLLWNYVIDGLPLNIIDVFLPTQLPELNPIELVFHILARQIRSYSMKINMGPMDNEVIRYAAAVMDNICVTTIAKCYQHCGYYIVSKLVRLFS